MKPERESPVHLYGSNECKLLIQIFLPSGWNAVHIAYVSIINEPNSSFPVLVFGMQNGKLFKKEEKMIGKCNQCR